MKCRYAYCKNNNNVEKEEAIKVGSAYYCKACYEEKEAKQKISMILQSMFRNETRQSINKCVAEIVHNKCFQTDYILYVLDHIEKSKCTLKGLYHIVYYLNDYKIRSQYDDMNKRKKYSEMKQSTFKSDNKEVEFHYKSSSGKGWCKVL